MIDLRLMAPGYRIELDPSAEGEPQYERVWYYYIPCKHGFISAHSPGILAAYPNRPKTARMLRQIRGVRVHPRCNLKTPVLFPVVLLDQVAAVLQACHRKQPLPTKSRSGGMTTPS